MRRLASRRRAGSGGGDICGGHERCVSLCALLLITGGSEMWLEASACPKHNITTGGNVAAKHGNPLVSTSSGLCGDGPRSSERLKQEQPTPGFGGYEGVGQEYDSLYCYPAFELLL